jgi:hypothetical protein
MKFLKWLCRQFCTIEIAGLKAVPNIETAMLQDYDAGICGNYIETNMYTNVVKCGQRQVMALRVKDPAMLRDMSERDKERIEKELRSLNFVWSGDFPKRPGGASLDWRIDNTIKDQLGSYYLQ